MEKALKMEELAIPAFILFAGNVYGQHYGAASEGEHALQN